jgi:hypothetical protein
LVKDNGLNWFGLCKLSECGFDLKLTLSLISLNEIPSLSSLVSFFAFALLIFGAASRSLSGVLGSW